MGAPPQKEPPRTETVTLQGRIACAVGHVSSSSDLCRFVSLDDEARSEFEVVPQLKRGSIWGAEYQLAWTPSVPLMGDSLSLMYALPVTEEVSRDTNGRHDEGIPIVSGPSVLRLRIHATGDEPLYFADEATSLFFIVRPARMTTQSLMEDPAALGGASVLVVDQEFTLCLLFSYRRGPPPEAPECA